MTKTITNSMMRRRLKQITNNAYTGMDGRRQITGEKDDTNTHTTVNPAAVSSVRVYKASYNRIKPPNTVILDDGRYAEALQPVWNLRSTPSSQARLDKNNVITLEETRRAEILEVGERRFMLSQSQPLTKAMELELHCGDTSIKLTGDGVDIKAQHVTINGRQLQ